jgi:1-deoxy-D-xylulose-5-phosphate synthase
VGKGRQVKEGERLAIITIGHVGNFALKASQILDNENISTAVYDMRFLKPLDKELMHTIFKKFEHIITVEDGAVNGGLGSAVVEFMSDNGYGAKVIRLGIPDKFVSQGTLQELYRDCGYDVAGIVTAGRKMVQKTQTNPVRD